MKQQLNKIHHQSIMNSDDSKNQQQFNQNQQEMKQIQIIGGHSAAYIDEFNNYINHPCQSITFNENTLTICSQAKFIHQHQNHIKCIILKLLGIIGVDSITKRHRKSFRRKGLRD